MTQNEQDIVKQAREMLATLTPGEWRIWIRTLETLPDESPRIEMDDAEAILHGDYEGEASLHAFIVASPILITELCTELEATRARLTEATGTLLKLVKAVI